MHGTYDHHLFGKVEFETKNNEHWTRGDPIISIRGDHFNSNDVVPADIPQLENVSHGKDGHPRLYRKAHPQFQAAFQLVESRGLLPKLHRVSTYNPRLRKPANGNISKKPSDHSFGTAMDLNPSDPRYGESAEVFADIFLSLGFAWGKKFPAPDPMHFEIEKFLSYEEVREILDKG